MLVLLVERSGHLVGKDELLESVWADSFVEEQNITRVIHMLRRALGEDDQGDKFIETVAKKGYRFVAEVTEVRETGEPTRLNGDGNGAAVGKLLPEPADAAQSGLSESTPRAAEPKPKTRIILFTVGFLTAVFLLVLLSFNFRSDADRNTNKIISIAVLPVRPLHTANRDEIYELGIADSLIIKLGSVKGLVARPLSATRKYADIEQDAITAGKEQQVDYVLASNYQLADGRIKITSQLINVASGQVEESYSFEKVALSVFAIQDAVAAEFGNKLISRFGGTAIDTATRRGTSNEEAYRLYLQGKNLMMIVNRDYRKKANEYFEQAIKLDPNFALAYIQLARVSESEEGRKSELIDKALELDPNLAEAYVARAETCLFNDWDFVAAEKNLAKAFELQPNLAEAHWLSALLSANRGQFDDGLSKIEIARTIDPSAIMYMYHRGRILYYARRYDEAVAQFQQAMDLDDRHMQPYAWMGRLYETKGDYERAYQLFLGREERSPRKDRLEIYKKAYETGGWMGVRYAGSGSTFFDKARLHALQNEKDAAFDNLNKAIENRDSMVTTLNVEPALDNLRDDPRFDDLLRRVGLK